MARTIQTVNARKILQGLNIPLRQRRGVQGVFVRCKKYRRVWFDDQGCRRYFYELGNAIGTTYEKEAIECIIANEEALLGAGVSIKYWIVNGQTFSADLKFGGGRGVVDVLDSDKLKVDMKRLLGEVVA